MLARVALPSGVRSKATRGRFASSSKSRSAKSFHSSSKLKDSVYAFGDNSYLQCSQYERETVNKPMKITDIAPFTEIESVECNWKSNFILQTNRQILAWGTNNFAQLCLPNASSEKVIAPLEATILETSEVQRIAAGRAHTAFLINTPSQVVTVGFGETGCIGTGKVDQQSYPWPQLVSTLDHCGIIDIQAGLDHTLALSSSGEVWSWGLDGSGQLGHGYLEDPCLALPTKITGIPAMVSVFTGCDHSGGIDASGNLWVWGSNLSGQLGVEDVQMTSTPLQSDWDPLRKIKKIIAGGHHTFIQTEENELWAAGRGDEGVLGIGDNAQGTNVSAWTKIDFFEKNGLKVKSCDTGFGHSLVLTEDGKVFAWGVNEVGQLGLGDVQSRYEPTELTYFNGLGVKGVACGPVHSLVWTDYNIM